MTRLWKQEKGYLSTTIHNIKLGPHTRMCAYLYHVDLIDLSTETLQAYHPHIQAERYNESNGYHQENPNSRSRRASEVNSRSEHVHGHPSGRVNGREEIVAVPQVQKSPNVSTSGLEGALRLQSPQPPRASNPMSMSNLLSDTAPSQPEATTASVPAPAPAPASAPAPALAPPPMAVSPPKPARKASRSIDESHAPIKAEIMPTTPVPDAPASSYAARRKSGPKQNTNGASPALAQTPPAPPNLPRGPPGLTVRATEEAFAQIEAREHSPIDVPGLEGAKQDYKDRVRKHTMELDAKENTKRKVRAPRP